jgi:hypothetical protein
MSESLKAIFRPGLKLLFLALLSLVLPAQATVYYVDSGSGSDSNAGTSTSAPWAHPPGSVGLSGSGWKVLQNGDKLVIKGGSVNNVSLYLRSSGSGDAPAYYNGNSAFDSIVIQSGHLFSPQWGTGQAVIDAQYTRNYGVGFETVNGVTLDGFEIRNIGPCYGCTFGGGSSACIEVSGPAKYFTIKRCWLHDAVRTGDDIGHGIEGAQAGEQQFLVYYNKFGPNIGTKAFEPYRFCYGAISNNLFLASGDHELSFGGGCTNIDVCNNLFYLSFATPGATNSQVHQPTYGISTVTAVNCDFWNNVVYAPTPRDGVSALGAYEYSISNRIVFNTFALCGDPANDAAGTAIALQKQIGDSDGNTNWVTIFQNNLCYKNSNADGNIQFCLPHPDYVANENVQYNVFWGGASTTESVMAYRPPGGSGDALSPASTYNPPSSGHTYANNVQADPVLTGGTLPTGLDANYLPNTAYFSLSAGSPASVTTSGNAISGDAVHGWDHSTGKFSKDILGRTRSAWSVGAYELASGSGALVSVTPSSQNFGSITAGGTSNLTFTVKNAGSSTLSGTATVPPPFQIASGGTYTLGANQSQVVTVMYAPANSGVDSQTVTFTGGGGATATVSGTALPTPPTGLSVIGQ